MASLKFSKTHEWAKLEEDIATIGITDYAQRSLGDVVFVELPREGTKVKQFLRFGTVESTKSASERYSPLSGEVIQINQDLLKNPQWVNEDPLGKGWMIKVKIEKKEELVALLDEKDYREFLKTQTH